MAKKSAKKSSSKPSRKAAARKTAPKKAGKKPARKTIAAPAGPEQVSTGKGATVREIASDLVAMFNSGKADAAGPKWWSNDITSIEGLGMAWHGRKSVDEKNSGWYQQNEILGGSAEGPFVGATGFAVKFKIHVRERATGKESHMEEVGVYTVRDGKVICEEFMYGG